MLFILVGILLSTLVHEAAASTFTPNCTLPEGTVTYVSTPPNRGTWDILSSSIFTILLCTWTVQHLSIPSQKDASKLNWFKRLSGRVLPKLQWMLLTLIVPEFLVGQAFQDWVLARRSLKSLKPQAIADGAEWTLTHAFFGNMGGFVVKIQEVDQTVVTISSPVQGPQTPAKAKGRSAAITVTDSAQYGSETTNILYLNAGQLGLVRYFEIIPKLPIVTADQIKDKSKGDFFVKAIAVIQVIWIVIQVIARTIKSLPISQLEISVLAFCLCAGVSYFFCWNKPQDVQVPFVLEATRPITQPQMAALKSASNRIFLQGRTLRDLTNPIEGPVVYPDVALTTFYSRKYYYRDLAMVIAGSIFGLPHALAWNYIFPSYAEQLLWRISSMICIAGPPFYFCIFMFRGYLEWQFPGLRDEKTTLHVGVDGAVLRGKKLAARIILLFDVLWGNISVALYVLSRLFLMVEMFRALFWLPPKRS